MEITKKRKVTENFIVGYVCDCCKNQFTDIMDQQEMVFYRNTGGFSSIFGDGAIMTLDLCQHCFKERLGDVIQFHGNSNF